MRPLRQGGSTLVREIVPRQLADPGAQQAGLEIREASEDTVGLRGLIVDAAAVLIVVTVGAVVFMFVLAGCNTV